MRSDVVEGIEQVVDLLADHCAQMEPDQVDSAEVGRLHRLLVRAEQLAAGARTRLARRVVDAPDWRAAGHRSPEEWIAATAGVTVTEARQTVSTSAELPDRPHLDGALGTGAVSAAQTRAILPGVKANPDAEAELVGRAADRTADLRDLRRRSQDLVAAADPDPDATRARHHRQRSLRTWTNDDGEWHCRGQGPADLGAQIMAAIKAASDAAFKAASAEGRREGADAYAFDGLVATLNGAAGDSAEGGATGSANGSANGSAKARERKVIGIVDVAALQRGELTADDTCRLAGVGPVSLSAMRDLLGESTAAVLIRRGTVDLAVAHLGRQPTAFQRTAVEARDYVCAVDGCGATRNLEIDHTDDWATTRRTVAARLDWLCPIHHGRKTRGQIRLIGPPGRRKAIPSRGRQRGRRAREPAD